MARQRTALLLLVEHKQAPYINTLPSHCKQLSDDFLVVVSAIPRACKLSKPRHNGSKGSAAAFLVKHQSQCIVAHMNHWPLRQTRAVNTASVEPSGCESGTARCCCTTCSCGIWRGVSRPRCRSSSIRWLLRSTRSLCRGARRAAALLPGSGLGRGGGRIQRQRGCSLLESNLQGTHGCSGSKAVGRYLLRNRHQVERLHGRLHERRQHGL